MGELFFGATPRLVSFTQLFSIAATQSFRACAARGLSNSDQMYGTQTLASCQAAVFSEDSHENTVPPHLGIFV